MIELTAHQLAGALLLAFPALAALYISEDTEDLGMFTILYTLVFGGTGIAYALLFGVWTPDPITYINALFS